MSDPSSCVHPKQPGSKTASPTLGYSEPGAFLARAPPSSTFKSLLRKWQPTDFVPQRVTTVVLPALCLSQQLSHCLPISICTPFHTIHTATRGLALPYLECTPCSQDRIQNSTGSEILSSMQTIPPSFGRNPCTLASCQSTEV